MVATVDDGRDAAGALELGGVGVEAVCVTDTVTSCKDLDESLEGDVDGAEGSAGPVEESQERAEAADVHEALRLGCMDIFQQYR